MRGAALHIMESGTVRKKRSRAARTALLLTAVLLVVLCSGCSWGGNVSNYEDDEEISVPSGNFTRLVIENRAGTIRIRSGNEDRVTGLLRKKASGTGTNLLKTVAGSVSYQVQADGDTLHLTEVFVTDDRIDFWEWKEATYPDVSIGLEYELTVPAGIQVVEVYQSAGNTEFTGYTGTVSIANNAGNITLSRVSLTGDSVIALVSGNLDLSFDRFDPTASLVTELTAGNVTINLPKNTNAGLEAGVDAGTISGNIDSLPVTNSAVTHVFGDGAARIAVRVDSGNIVIKVA